MELFDAIKNTPLLRPNALPAAKNIGIICFSSAFSNIPDILLDNAQVIFIIDSKEDQLIKYSEDIFFRKNREIHILPFFEISSRIDLILVFYHHNVEYHPIGHCYRYLRNAGYESFYTFMPIPHTNDGMTFIHNPDYYATHKDDLEKVFDIFEDEESRKIFSARIRAIVSGCLGYLRVSKYEEYFHPFVCLNNCDIIIDGGVSEYIGPQIKFFEKLGQDGKWFGFEPDPIGFHSANDKIKELNLHADMHHLIPLGLWSKKDRLQFEILGQGTHVNKTKVDGSIECNVISIDEFVRDNNLNRVDFIKLDIEGAEFNALKGCIQTITKYRPKLAISLYHQLQDLYLIPIFLKEICDNYEFYLGHHHATLHETILYAKQK